MRARSLNLFAANRPARAKTRTRVVAVVAAVAVVGTLGACSSGGSSDASYDQGIAYDDSFATEEWRDVPVDEQEEYDDSPEQPFQDVSTSRCRRSPPTSTPRRTATCVAS